MMPPEEEGTFVRVTNREIYAKLVSMELAQAATNGRLDLMAKDNATLREKVSTNTKTIAQLQSRMNGVFAGIGTGAMVALVAIFRGVIG